MPLLRSTATDHLLSIYAVLLIGGNLKKSFSIELNNTSPTHKKKKRWKKPKDSSGSDFRAKTKPWSSKDSSFQNKQLLPGQNKLFLSYLQMWLKECCKYRWKGLILTSLLTSLIGIKSSFTWINPTRFKMETRDFVHRPVPPSSSVLQFANPGLHQTRIRNKFNSWSQRTSNFRFFNMVYKTLVMHFL